MENQQNVDTASFILSIPNFNLISGAIGILRFIDDLAYFQYHMHRFDRQFAFVSKLSYDINQGKWVPQSINNAFDRVGLSYAEKFPKTPIYRLPPTFVVLEDEPCFLRVT